MQTPLGVLPNQMKLNNKQSRKMRKKLIRVAEGYLELMTMFEDRWPLDPKLAEVLADRAITTLDKTPTLKTTSNEKTRLRYRSHVFVLKGQACRSARRYAQAIEHFEHALEFDPESFETLLAVAWCYKRANRLDDAIDAVEKATHVDPASPIAHYNLACYFAVANQPEASVVHLAIAFDLESELFAIVDSESDFDTIRDNPEFVALISTPPHRSEKV